MTDKSEEKQTPALSLDQAVSLLMTADTADRDSWSPIHKSLKAIAEKYPEDSSIRQNLSRASLKILEVIKNISDASDVQADVTGFIEAAQKEIEAQEKSSSAPQESHAPPASESSFSLIPSDADPELLSEFINESTDYIEQAEAALLTLETNPEDNEAVNTVFRAFHTVKGTSGFLGLAALIEFAHLAESLLSRVRDGEIRYAGGYADLSLQSVDMLKELIDQVKGVLNGRAAIKPDKFDHLLSILKNPEAAGVSANSMIDSLPPRLGDILVAEGKVGRDVMEQIATGKGNEPLGTALVNQGAAKASDVGQALRTQKQIASADKSSDSTIKVRMDRLDQLIDMVGEMVIAHSMIAEDESITEGNNYDLLRKISHAGKIVRELQDLGMSMRMVPLKPTFQKMARLVRDVSQKVGKQVNFVTEGEDTEIDRNMVDRVGDPLVHMVRNAVDHGIEDPETRRSKGKATVGTLKLSAYNSGGNVVIELTDDGKGLDRDKILQKALSKGLIEPGKILSDREVYNLIFMPGFSTAEKVTDLSGRGVGMDVVKRNIESLNGRVAIFSELGKGTTFSIQLPMTLAITDGMLVRVGTEKYIIPVVNIQMSFRPTADQLYTIAGKGEMVKLRNDILPLVRLHHLFHVSNAVTDPAKGLLAIVGDGNRRCVFLVDELLGQQQVVAKSLGRGMGKVPGITGGAILGDGRVGLILDPVEIISIFRQDNQEIEDEVEVPSTGAAAALH